MDSGRLLATQEVPYLSERNPPLVLSPDGRLLATSHPDGVAVFDAQGLRPRFVLPGQDDGVSALAFSPDGSKLAAGFTSGTSIVWEVARQRPVRTFRGHSQPVEDVVFKADGRGLHTVSTDGQLLSWDVAGPGTFPSAREFPENPTDAYEAFPSPDGATVAYPAYAERYDKNDPDYGREQIRFRDVESGRLTPPRRLVREGPSYYDVAWSPDSREFAFSAGAVKVPGRGLVRHNLQLWDAATGAAVYTDVGAGVDSVKYAADGQRMVILSEEREHCHRHRPPDPAAGRCRHSTGHRAARRLRPAAGRSHALRVD